MESTVELSSGLSFGDESKLGFEGDVSGLNEKFILAGLPVNLPVVDGRYAFECLNMKLYIAICVKVQAYNFEIFRSVLHLMDAFKLDHQGLGESFPYTPVWDLVQGGR